MTLWRLLLGFLKGRLGRILDTIGKHIDATTEREPIKTEAGQTFLNAQAQVLTGRGCWFSILFLAPAGFWFGAVCVGACFGAVPALNPQDGPLPLYRLP